jgi:hypothetical protein
LKHTGIITVSGKPSNWEYTLREEVVK